MLTRNQLRFFHDNGYLRLGRTLALAELQALQQRLDDLMLGHISYDGLYVQMDSDTGRYDDLGAGGYQGPSLDYRKLQGLERDPLFLVFMRKPLFRDLCHTLIGPDIACYRAMVMNKPAHRGTVLPYHQDGGTQWHLDRERFVTVWTALDPASIENGCMQVIPGSQRLGLLSERGHTITFEQEARYCRDEESLFLEAGAGDSILLNNYLLHRSGVNSSPHSRRAFSVVYMDAATRSTLDGSVFPHVFGGEALLGKEAPHAE